MKRLASLVVILAALTAVLSACATAPVGHDERVTVGDGFAVVHVPVAKTHIGVVALHSLSYTYQQPIQEGWSTLADEKGFVAIYPDRGTSWNAGICCSTAAYTQRDDSTWLASLIMQMRVRYGLTTIYLTGFSNGGMMVERLVAEHPEITNRFAVWGAAPEMPVAGHWSGYGAIYDGAKDTTVPYAGGQVKIINTVYTIRPALTTKNWLIGASLKGVVVPGYGHTPQPGWPTLAWSELSR